MPFGPALCVLEFKSVARGYEFLNEVLKHVSVKVIEASAVPPGKFFLLLGGGIKEVQQAYDLAAQQESDFLDLSFISNPDPQILTALYAQNQFPLEESLGIVETVTTASGLVSAAMACKDNDVRLIDFRHSRGVGGRCFYFLTGRQASVTKATEAGKTEATKRGHFVGASVIQSPHADFRRYFDLN